MSAGWPSSTSRVAADSRAVSTFRASTSNALIAWPESASDRPCRVQDSANRSTIGTRKAPVPHAGSTITEAPRSSAAR